MAVATVLTLVGLLTDIAGFILAWREYESALRAADRERLEAVAETGELLKPVDTIAFRQTIHRRYMSGGKVVKEETEQVPIHKKPEVIAKELADRERRLSERRLERLGGLGAQLVARGNMFRAGAWMIVAGFVLQFLGALPIFN